jgi:hypothetical protein
MLYEKYQITYNRGHLKLEKKNVTAKKNSQILVLKNSQ